MIGRLVLSLVVSASWASVLSAQVPEAGPAEIRFVVLGHIRGAEEGGLNPKLGELLTEVRTLEPAFAVLTGDIIWGDLNSTPRDPARVEGEWDEVDAAVDTLGVPVFRVPGNHDISDVATRDIWLRRYGALYQSVSVAGVRLLLLSTTWIPEGNVDSDEGLVLGRGVDLDADQMRWLETELSDSETEPTFAFMHHLLWWGFGDSHWWTIVHPLLAQAGVKSVFSGDYGPLKFSSTERDGLPYYQTSIETPVSLPMLQLNIPSRVLSAQFDNFLEVIVRGSEVDVRVHTIGEVSSGEFTPERHRSIVQGPPAPVWMRLMDFVGTPRRIAAILLVLSFAFGAGWWIGRRRR